MRRRYAGAPTQRGKTSLLLSRLKSLAPHPAVSLSLPPLALTLLLLLLALAATSAS